jgi:hypothetical protein
MQLFTGKNVIKLQFLPFTAPSSNSSSGGFQAFGSPAHMTSPHSLCSPVANFRVESGNERVMSIGAKSCAHCRCLLHFFNIHIHASFIHLKSCFFLQTPLKISPSSIFGCRTRAALHRLNILEAPLVQSKLAAKQFKESPR